MRGRQYGAVIAQLVQTSEDGVGEVIGNFNRTGLACLDPKWAGGRPPLTSDEDIGFIVETAECRPEKQGCPFTRWSSYKLAGYLADNRARIVRVSRKRLRQILEGHEITFQRTKTGKESNDPDRDAKR